MAFPETGILDDFNRTDESPLDAETWGEYFGTLKVSGNACASDADDGGSYWLTEKGPDVEIYATITTLQADGNSVVLFADIDAEFTDSIGFSLFIERNDAGDDRIYFGPFLSTTYSAIIDDLQAGDSFGFSYLEGIASTYYKPVGGSWELIDARSMGVGYAAGYIGLIVPDTTARVDDFGGGTIAATPDPGEGGTPGAYFTLDGTPVDLIGDMRASTPIEVRYGIDGTGPTNRVASTGVMTFALDNSEHNSAGLLGYYAPGHANCRTGFEVGVPCSLAITYGGVTYTKFRGTLESIDPESGQYLNRSTHCQAVDWMDAAARQKVRLIPTQTNKRGEQLIATIVAEMATQPAATSYATGDSVFPYSLDNSRDEKSSPMSEFQRIALSELGFIFIKGSTAGGGMLTFQARSTRPSALASLVTIDDEMTGMTVKRERSAVYNRIKITTHPRRIDAAATTVLFELTGTPKVKAGASITLLGQYRDPDQKSVRCGGMNMVQPVATTDYTINTDSGGGGSDLTSSCTVTASYGGNGVELVVTNNSASDGYVTLLQCRGRGVYDDNPVVSEASDATSIAAYGENVLSIDMPMQDDSAVGQDAADYLLAAYKDPHSAIDSIAFCGNASVELMTAGLAREPGDRVTIVETATGVSGDYTINAVTMTIEAPGIYWFAWRVAPTTQFEAAGLWLIGVETRSEIGETTAVGY